MTKGRKRKYGFSFSLRRLLGIQTMKQRIARTTGIPTTRQGRQRKVGRIVINSMGYLLTLLMVMALLCSVICCCLGGVLFSGGPSNTLTPTSTAFPSTTPISVPLVVTTASNATTAAEIYAIQTLTAMPASTNTPTPTSTNIPTLTAAPSPTQTPTLSLAEIEYLKYIGHQVSLIHGRFLSLDVPFQVFLETKSFSSWRANRINPNDEGWVTIYPLAYLNVCDLADEYIDLHRGYSVFSSKASIPPRFVSIHHEYIKAVDIFFAVADTFVKALNDENVYDMTYSIEQIYLSKTQVDAATEALSITLGKFDKTVWDFGFPLYY